MLRIALGLLGCLNWLTASVHAQPATAATYVAGVKKELTAVWPQNRTINLVFHGHSVPAGYWHDHEVHTLESYPNLVLERLKKQYPYAVINVIVTAIGGENSIKGQTRFEPEVLPHKADVLFIDYALNDRFSDIGKVREAWETMIQAAQARQIPVILLTPSPDQRIDIADPSNPLEPYVQQIRQLAGQYHTGLADPYPVFQQLTKAGKQKEYMSHVNHPNKAGHEVIAAEIMKWFIP
ncbi:SGNH/GDSL hydrolase family protein [Arsenicibacter rosenii]|uniref:Lipase n=1 Tax=Arsenicibacter rosenii TaxID=1750698 RepID=A0A1S2VCA3_9BACT|nr:SGNH/GDSL hydrolase family protein [Arsenicibacter rosenii]OIN55945.1 lipase [Arsenicibacter rosenii]